MGVSKRDGGTIHRGVAEGAGDPARSVEADESRDAAAAERGDGRPEVGSHGGDTAVEAWRRRARRALERLRAPEAAPDSADRGDTFDTRSTIRGGSQESRDFTDAEGRQDVDGGESTDESAEAGGSAALPLREGAGGAHLDETEGATSEGAPPRWPAEIEGRSFRPFGAAFRADEVRIGREEPPAALLEVLLPDGSHVAYVRSGERLGGLDAGTEYHVRPIRYGRLGAIEVLAAELHESRFIAREDGAYLTKPDPLPAEPRLDSDDADRVVGDGRRAEGYPAAERTIDESGNPPHVE